MKKKERVKDSLENFINEVMDKRDFNKLIGLTQEELESIFNTLRNIFYYEDD